MYTYIINEKPYDCSKRRSFNHREKISTREKSLIILQRRHKFSHSLENFSSCITDGKNFYRSGREISLRDNDGDNLTQNRLLKKLKHKKLKGPPRIIYGRVSFFCEMHLFLGEHNIINSKSRWNWKREMANVLRARQSSPPNPAGIASSRKKPTTTSLFPFGNVLCESRSHAGLFDPSESLEYFIFGGCPIHVLCLFPALSTEGTWPLSSVIYS